MIITELKILILCGFGIMLLGGLAFFGFIDFDPKGDVIQSSIVGFIGVLTFIGFFKIIRFEIFSFNKTR